MPGSSESDMRKKVVKLLKPLHAVSVENGVGAGTPDVNCTLGWIELKSVAQPKRDTTVVNCDHFTKNQRLWLRERWAAGGGAWLLLKVGRYWLLFDGPTAAKHVGASTLDELKEHATFWMASARCVDALPTIMREYAPGKEDMDGID